MSNIIDNKKVATLVVKNGESYETISPETLATAVNTVENSAVIDETVQQHIDEETIHFTKSDMEDSLVNKPDVSQRFVQQRDIVGGTNIIIESEDDKVKISTDIPDVSDFLTKYQVIPTEGIVINDTGVSPELSLGLNFDQISNRLANDYTILSTNSLKSSNNSINITADPNNAIVDLTVDVDNAFVAGDGIKIEDGEISNTKPDIPVSFTSESGTIIITGEYPNFDLKGRTGTRIENWVAHDHYYVGDISIHEAALFECLIEHDAGTVFEVENALGETQWRMLAGWFLNRELFAIDAINDVENSEGEIIAQYLQLSTDVSSEESLIVNLGGLVVQAHNYTLNADLNRIYFNNFIPKTDPDVFVEVVIMSNVVLNAYDNGANIEEFNEDESKPITHFTEGNVCIYKSALYKCLTPPALPYVFDPKEWELLSGYVYKIFSLTTTEPTTIIEVPSDLVQYITNKNSLEINVGNVVLQKRAFNLIEENTKIEIVEPIDGGIYIEVGIFGNSILQESSIPQALEDNLYLRSLNNTYVTVTVDQVAESLKYDNKIEDKENHYLRVNSDASNTEFVSTAELMGSLKVRNHAVGLIQSSTVHNLPIPPIYTDFFRVENDFITINTGGILSNDDSVYLEITEPMIIDPFAAFGEETLLDSVTAIGSAVVLEDSAWTQPIMTAKDAPLGQVSSYPENTSEFDREAWRAMDGLPIGQGNGWLVNSTTAQWVYRPQNYDLTPLEILVKEIHFYNQGSGISNRSREIDLWVNTPENVVHSFTAINEDYGHSHVVIPVNTRMFGTAFGLTVKNSYGTTVGMNEIDIVATMKGYIKQNGSYNTYLIGKEDGSDVKVLTLPNTISDNISDYLPDTYSKWVRVGSFDTDNNYRIINLYPKQDLGDSYTTGTLNGSGALSSATGYIETYMFDINSNITKRVVEQWGETMATPTSKVMFPESYKENVFFVNSSNYMIESIELDGFTIVGTATTPVKWNAKGI